MSGFVVTVDVHLWPGNQAAFRALVDVNARASVTKEPGCRRFDVIEPGGQPNSVMLYEIYADRDAFDAHLASDHYREFIAASEPLCASKTVVTGALVCEGGG